MCFDKFKKPEEELEIFKQLKKDMAEGWLSKKEEKLINNLKQDFVKMQEELAKVKEENQQLKKFKIDKPEIKGSISYNELRKKLKNIAPNAQIWLSDKVYYLTDKKELQRFLKKNKTNLKQYESVYHDCDDFSYELMGAASNWCSELAFGIIWGKVNSGHAWNIFIDNKKKIWSVEPQNDRVRPIKSKVKPKDIWLIII